MKNTEFRNEQIWLAVGSLMILATVALAAALVYTRDVMIPFVLAIFITAVVAPLVDFQVRRWRLPTWLAVLTTLLLVLVLLALIGVVLIVAVQTMYHVASEYSAQVVALANQFLTRLKDYNIHVDQAHITQELESHLPTLITQTAGTVTSIISHGFLIVFFVVFLLVGRNPLQRHDDIYADIESTIRGYITTMTVISADHEPARRHRAVAVRPAHGVAVRVAGVRLEVHPEHRTDHRHAAADPGRGHAISRSVDDPGRRRDPRRDPHDDRQPRRAETDGPRPGVAPRHGALGAGLLGTAVGHRRHGAGRADRRHAADRLQPLQHDAAARESAGRSFAGTR